MNDEELKEIDGGEITFHLWLCYNASLMWLGKSQGFGTCSLFVLQQFEYSLLQPSSEPCNACCRSS